MPRFFIDTDDGSFSHRDEEGHELASLDAARRELLDALPDMARQSIPDGDRRKFKAALRDEQGTVVYEASLTLEGRWKIPR